MSDHNDIYSIVERLAILEGRISPTTKQPISAEPASALLKPKAVAEAKLGEGDMVEDVLGKVKKSFNDYLKSLEGKKKSDSDIKPKGEVDHELKKKEIKDRDLIAKVKDVVDHVADKVVDEADPVGLEEDHRQLEIGDRIAVVAPNHYEGDFGTVVEFAPSGKFVVVRMDNGDEASMHVSDVEFHDDQEDVEDWEDDVAECSTPVKTVQVGDFLAEIHGDQSAGFEVRCNGRPMKSKFKDLDHAVMALEMFNARRAAQQQEAQNQDYMEEK
jgi:hypothetical protein